MTTLPGTPVVGSAAIPTTTNAVYEITKLMEGAVINEYDMVHSLPENKSPQMGMGEGVYEEISAPGKP